MYLFCPHPPLRVKFKVFSKAYKARQDPMSSHPHFCSHPSRETLFPYTLSTPEAVISLFWDSCKHISIMGPLHLLLLLTGLFFLEICTPRTGLQLAITLSENMAFPDHPIQNSTLSLLSASLLHLDFLQSINATNIHLFNPFMFSLYLLE